MGDLVNRSSDTFVDFHFGPDVFPDVDLLIEIFKGEVFKVNKKFDVLFKQGRFCQLYEGTHHYKDVVTACKKLYAAFPGATSNDVKTSVTKAKVKTSVTKANVSKQIRAEIMKV